MKSVYGDARIAIPQDPFVRPDGYNIDFACEDKQSEEIDNQVPDLPTSDDFDSFE